MQCHRTGYNNNLKSPKRCAYHTHSLGLDVEEKNQPTVFTRLLTRFQRWSIHQFQRWTRDAFAAWQVVPVGGTSCEGLTRLSQWTQLISQFHVHLNLNHLRYSIFNMLDATKSNFCISRSKYLQCPGNILVWKHNIYIELDVSWEESRTWNEVFLIMATCSGCKSRRRKNLWDGAKMLAHPSGNVCHVVAMWFTWR